MSEATQRRLSAIVSADVVGYSRLMGRDEEGTLAALRAHRNAIDPVLFNHGGRIVKTTGDGLLLEFPSAVAAVDAAIATQGIMSERNASVPEERRIWFRIGIHVGEILVDGDDIFGDAVNIAARLQEAAEAGGISLSGPARDAAWQRIDAPLVDLGESEFKNIDTPVRHWRIDMKDGDGTASRYRPTCRGWPLLPDCGRGSRGACRESGSAARAATWRERPTRSPT